MIKCKCCNQEFPDNWGWWVCNHCGNRVCPACLGKQAGKYGSGQKCGECADGQMKPKDQLGWHGICTIFLYWCAVSVTHD